MPVTKQVEFTFHPAVGMAPPSRACSYVEPLVKISVVAVPVTVPELVIVPLIVVVPTLVVRVPAILAVSLEARIMFTFAFITSVAPLATVKSVPELPPSVIVKLELPASVIVP
jgi:hypothetical protein